ncbi:NADH:ubiquinone oxidoreductase [Brachyspira pilosicoli]|uniref:NADH:ubiquinone oxidoreductase n=1 Tax=Brachyspira pilosicoli TaxID=52584 RepID=UPI000C7803E0|nr:NADH:ubiquinone oxidoreductase [Brachyspira pilosicoli]PLV56554.1 NADH:ubiquinone oxidoreductase I, membrane subunit N [Brachyspira pilosicoli SP16]
MANIKNKVIFSFLCLIFYTALSLSFYLIPFNSKVLSIIAVICAAIFSIFFLLPAFLYSPVYSIVIAILHYMFFRLFEIIRMFTILDSTPVTSIYIMLQSALGIIMNVIGIILTCLTIYFMKKYIKNKGLNFNINMALITALIIAFIRFVVSGISLSSFFLNFFVINKIYISNDLIIQQIVTYVISVIVTFIAVMISYFIYIKIKDKAFFVNNLNNNENILNNNINNNE